MAKKMEAEKNPAQAAKVPTKVAYLKYCKAMDAARAELSEIKGGMGSAKARAMADHNMHSDADQIADKYSRKSPRQQAEFILHLITYFEYRGLGNEAQTDIETTAERKARIKAEAAREPEAIEGRGDARAREDMELVQ